MRVMIRLSLLLNILVLTPICVGLVTDASWIGNPSRRRAAFCSQSTFQSAWSPCFFFSLLSRGP